MQKLQYMKHIETFKTIPKAQRHGKGIDPVTKMPNYGKLAGAQHFLLATTDPGAMYDRFPDSVLIAVHQQIQTGIR